MTRRMWKWAAGVGVPGLVFLALAIHARATWTPPADSDAVITLGQVLGLIFSGGLIVVAGLILLTGVRRDLAGRRRRRWMSQHLDD